MPLRQVLFPQRVSSITPHPLPSSYKPIALWAALETQQTTDSIDSAHLCNNFQMYSPFCARKWLRGNKRAIEQSPVSGTAAVTAKTAVRPDRRHATARNGKMKLKESSDVNAKVIKDDGNSRNQTKPLSLPMRTMAKLSHARAPGSDEYCAVYTRLVTNVDLETSWQEGGCLIEAI